MEQLYSVISSKSDGTIENGYYFRLIYILIYQPAETDPLMYHNHRHYKPKNHHHVKYVEKDIQGSHSERPDKISSPYIPKPKSKISHLEHSNDSVQTCESQRSAHREPVSQGGNLKVQLCKNFIAKGYCPYQSRCRFAHGVEELRARDDGQSSELYRTRKCRIFFERGECKFGERCNFRHTSRLFPQIMTPELTTKMRVDFPQILMISSSQKGHYSRLLALLQQE